MEKGKLMLRWLILTRKKWVEGNADRSTQRAREQPHLSYLQQPMQGMERRTLPSWSLF